MANKRKDATLNKYVYITIVLIIMNFTVSLLVVYYRHLNIISMSRLQDLVTEQDNLYQEWTQLLLEQSTLVSYTRVDSIARKQLAMDSPKLDDIKILDISTQSNRE